MKSQDRVRRIEYLLGTLLSLVAADGIITQFLVEGGLAREGNPLLRTFVTESDFLVIKMSGAILCVLILWRMAKRLPKLVFIFSSCIVVLYTGILFWNLSVFLLLRAQALS